MTTYAVSPGWAALARDLGVDAAEVLRGAGLPADLLARPGARLRGEQFFSLWLSAGDRLAARAGPHVDVALAVADSVSAEVFDPPLFAGLCSPDLSVAAERVATYKRLAYPVTLDVRDEDELSIAVAPRGALQPPASLARFEVLFWVAFARLATREAVVPVRVELTEDPPDARALATWLGGARPRRGERNRVVFSRADARRRFATANEQVWRVFEPGLRRGLADLEQDAGWADRVGSVLLSALPAGRGSLADVASDLHVSARSLQRRLAAEGTSFQRVLDLTRERLAWHYLTTTTLSDTEIAFLIGYDEQTSFHRAFRTWTDTTPGRVRAAT